MTLRRALVGVALLLLAAVGVLLVVTGGEDAEDGPAVTAPQGRPDPTLAIDDLSIAGVEELSGLDVPEEATDFLTARLEDDRQLDVTFTMPPGAEASFLSGSRLPPLAEGARVLLHASPLWKLNPDGTLRGAADVSDGVNRAVELVPEGDRVRVRITLQAV